MSFKDRILSGIKEALKSHDALTSGVLRMVVAAAQNKEIEKRTAGKDPALTDDDYLGILRGGSL